MFAEFHVVFIACIMQFVCVAVILRYLSFVAYWNYLIAIFKFATLFCAVMNRHDCWLTVTFIFYFWTNFQIAEWQSFEGLGRGRKLILKYISEKLMVRTSFVWIRLDVSSVDLFWTRQWIFCAYQRLPICQLAEVLSAVEEVIWTRNCILYFIRNVSSSNVGRPMEVCLMLHVVWHMFPKQLLI